MLIGWHALINISLLAVFFLLYNYPNPLLWTKLRWLTVQFINSVHRQFHSEIFQHLSITFFFWLLKTSIWKQHWKNSLVKRVRKCALYHIYQRFYKTWVRAYHLRRSDLTEMQVERFSSRKGQNKGKGWSKCKPQQREPVGGKRHLRVNTLLMHNTNCGKNPKESNFNKSKIMQFIECERYEWKVGENFCGILFEKVKLEFCKAYVNMVRIFNCGSTLPN